jgi:hypothetical protein
MVSIEELEQHPKNPNRHPKRQIELLAKIIKNQGWRNPITVSNLSKYIIRGHARYEAALLLGLKKVPVDFQQYATEEEELTDLIADNKIAELAKMEDDLTAQILKGLGKTGIDLDLTGFTPAEINRVIEKGKKKKIEPEVEFTEELHESSNYIVLYFDNDIDWLQALTLFELKTVKALDSKPGFEKKGIGRVVNGAEALNRLME